MAWCHLPERACHLSARACQLPERACQLSARACQLPERACQLPERACQLPERALRHAPITRLVRLVGNDDAELVFWLEFDKLLSSVFVPTITRLLSAADVNTSGLFLVSSQNHKSCRCLDLRRSNQDGVEHAHAFIENGDATRFCRVTQKRSEPPRVTSGLKDMKIMKTTKSSFTNFVDDEYRSLPDMSDRIFCTVVYASWDYSDLTGLDFDRAWTQVKDTVLEVFAGPPATGVLSPSVQKTLYDTQKLAMARIPQLSQMHIQLPNVHAYTYDFSKHPRVGITSNNEVYQPTDKPSGDIEATLRRKATSKL